VGDTITIINPQGRATPFGTSIRQVGYEVGAIFEVGIYDYDEKFVVLPIKDAQTLLLMGDSIGMIEVTVDDPDRVGQILEPLAAQLTGKAVIADWKTINSALFEALQVERVAMAFALSFMVLVAAFNILSSLVMLVRAKTRDIAIMRTMGATRRSLLKIFVTTGTTVGAIGTFAGLVLGAIVLFFRDCRFHRLHHRAGNLGSAGAVPFHPAIAHRSVGDRRDCYAGAGDELPRNSLSGAEGGQYRSGAGAAL